MKPNTDVYESEYVLKQGFPIIQVRNMNVTKKMVLNTHGPFPQMFSGSRFSDCLFRNVPTIFFETKQERSFSFMNIIKIAFSRNGICIYIYKQF